MAHLIDKDAILAEIEKLVDKGKYHEEYDCAYRDGNNGALYALKGKVNYLEVKEVDLEEEPVSEDLGEYIDKLSKQFPEVSFAKLSRIAVRVAKWQKENLWKPADGEDLPIFDREVIALLDNGKVVFAHRPPEYWDGKDIATGKVTRHYPKTYDKGGWNIPNVKYWLDCLMPKEIEL